MRTAIVTLATNDYIIGAENLFYSIYKNIDERNIDFYYATDVETKSALMSKIGAKNIILNENYSKINTDQKTFKEVSKKFFAFKMFEYGDYDRVIFFDSDMLCNGNINFMFSHELNEYPFWAARDYGCIHYYPEQHKKAELVFEKTFNSGSFIINRSILNKEFFEKLKYQCENELFSYDSGDQGYLNSFFIKNKMEIGLYDINFNYALDTNYPKRDFDDIVIIHYTGKKPWKISENEYKDNIFYDLWNSTKKEHEFFLYSLRNKQSIAGLKDLISYIPEESVCVEIGSFIAESSKLIAEKCSKLYCVDPWNNNFVNINMDESIAESFFDNRTKDVKNIIKIKDFSTNYSKKIKNKSIDFVYIDGMHDYDNVKADILAWLPKIKDNGIICGHDFYEDFPGCIEAVREVLGEPHIVFDDTSWFIFMNDNRIKILSSDEIVELYDETYYLGGYSEEQERFMGVDGWQEFKNGIISSKKIDSINKLDFKNKVIFDIGFGRGELLKYCYENGSKKCFGIDYSAAAFNIAKNFLNNEDVKIFNSSINNIDISLIDTKIDCIYMIDVLEHAQDHEWIGFFEKIKSIVSDNVVVYIETPTHQLNTGEYLGMHNNYTTKYYIKNIFNKFFKAIEIDRVDGWYCVKLYDFIKE